MATPEAAILHVDMDAFYASVEVLRDPSLAGKPLVVGGAGARGVVASCSYEARLYGIHSAMPSARARRLCAHAVFVPGDHELYREYSRRMHEILLSFTPLVEGLALDEAFLDVSGARRLFGPPVEIARSVRRRLWEELSLPASVGVATSKLMAKLASRAAKPRAEWPRVRPGAGVVVVPAGEELAVLHPLPVSDLWGIGSAGAETLRRLGVRTVGELAAVPQATLVARLGEAAGRHLYELAWARDARPVQPVRAPKSVGHEETYAVDVTDEAFLHREVVRMADAVASRLRSGSVRGRTVTLKVRFPDFATITRSQSLHEAVDTASEVAGVALALLAQLELKAGVRLLGVSVSNLTEDASRQLGLWTGPRLPAVEAWRAVDEVRRRFGPAAVRPAVVMDDPRVVEG